MKQTENFFLKLFEGTDKFDYKVVNENWQKIDDAIDELLNGGNIAILPTMTIEKIENGYRITTHDAKGSHSFEIFSGKDGKTAFQYAQDGGYTGTEEDFASDIAKSGAVGKEINRLSNEILVERARINKFVSLEEGSTTGDAELMDIRIGANGKTYESAGEAVRRQVSTVMNALNIKSFPNLIYIRPEILLNYYIPSSGVDGGVLQEDPKDGVTRCAMSYIYAVDGSEIRCADGYEVYVFKYDDYPFTIYEKYTSEWVGGTVYLTEGVYACTIRKVNNVSFNTVDEAINNVRFYLNTTSLKLQPYKVGLNGDRFSTKYYNVSNVSYPTYLEKGTYISSNVNFSLRRFNKSNGTVSEVFARNSNIYYITESDMYILEYTTSSLANKDIIISTKENCAILPQSHISGNIINSDTSFKCEFRLNIPIIPSGVPMVYIVEWEVVSSVPIINYTAWTRYYTYLNTTLTEDEIRKWSIATPTASAVRGDGRLKRAYAFCIKPNLTDVYFQLDNVLNAESDNQVELLRYNVYAIPENALGITNILNEIKGKDEDEDEDEDEIYDKPQSMGVLHALLRAKQLCDIEYTPVETLPNQVGDFPANVAVKGLPYSSTREVDKMIGVNLSLYTFMSAIQNPKAKIYTETLTTSNAKCYYGIVCTSFTNYCLDIPYSYTTTEYPRIQGMKQKHYQDVKLGDLLITSTETQSGHIIMITGIVRDQYGRIKKLEFTEGKHPKVTRSIKTYNDYVKYFIEAGYILYEYEGIANVSYTATPFVPLMDEIPLTVEYPDIICDLGDRATCKAGETISANVIDRADYTSIEVYKDGSLISTHGVEDITFENISAGSYEVKLVSETKTSSTFFIVVDYTISKEGNRVYFTSTNSTPLNLSLVGTDHGNRYIIPLTDEDIKNGYKDVDISQYTATISYIKVYFENEYGSVGCKLEI